MSVDPLEKNGVAVAYSLAMRVHHFTRRFPLAANGVLSLVDQAVVSGTAFVTAVLVARSTTQDELGRFYLTLSIVLIILGIQDQLVASPYNINSKRFKGRGLAEYAGSCWCHNLAFAALTVATLLLGIGAAWLAGATGLVPGLAALAVVSPLLLCREAIRRFALADLRLPTALAIDIPVAIVQIGGLLLLSWLGKLTLVTVFGTMGLACALAAAGWWQMRRKPIRLNRDRVVSDWRDNWSLSKWALQSFLVGNLTPYIMPWMLSVMIDTAAAGVFGPCVTLLGVTNIFVLGVGNILMPQAAEAFSERGSAGLRRVLLQSLGFFTLVLGAFCLAVTVAGEQVAVLVFGPEFEGTRMILIALAISVLAGSLQMAAGMGLWVVNQTRSNFVADIWWTATTLLSAAALIPVFGVLGAAIATAGGMVAGMLVRLWILMRIMNDLPDASDDGQSLREQPSVVLRDRQERSTWTRTESTSPATTKDA